MDYDFWSQIFERGGVDAVQAALGDFAPCASEDELDAAVDLACQVVDDDTDRVIARVDRIRARKSRFGKGAAVLEH
ncbi:hypothetical protein [Streptomyces sp. NPDC051452]|uniref:hypothetical protein n=1 Tax=Streptomyces sp. NPDC051452 TaxID=3365654 RepID=UPI00379196D2